MDKEIAELNILLKRICGVDFVGLVEVLIDFSYKVTERVDTAVDKINSLQVDEIDLKQKLKNCGSKLTEVSIKADSYSEVIGKLLRFADLKEEAADAMKKDFEAGKFKRLNEYLKQIKKYIEQSCKHYEDFLSAFNKAESSCKDTLNECEKKKVEAQNRKTVARVVGGGVATVATAAAGFTLSVVAGAFTFGIGTALGLGLMAGGLGVAGVSGITTHLVAQSFGNICEAFQSICRSLEVLGSEVQKVNEKSSKMQAITKSIKDDAENLSANIEDNVNYHQFCDVFAILLETVKNAREKMKKMKCYKQKSA